MYDVVLKSFAANEFNDGLPNYAVVTLSPELIETSLKYMEIVKNLNKDNHSVYALEIFDYSPVFFQMWSDEKGFKDSDELINEEELDRTEICKFKDPLIVPDNACTRMDTMMLTVTDNKIYWKGCEKYSGDVVETSGIMINALLEHQSALQKVSK